MISANNVTYRVGKKALFEDVNIKFTEGNCYGLIGANGAGKSTFLKILSGQLETTNGDITMTPGQRLSVLEQDHFKYDEYPVMDVVIMGNERLYQIMKEKDAIYAKEDFTDEDGIRASELEAEFAEMDGWEAESNAANALSVIECAVWEAYPLFPGPFDAVHAVDISHAPALLAPCDAVIVSVCKVAQARIINGKVIVEPYEPGIVIRTVVGRRLAVPVVLHFAFSCCLVLCIIVARVVAYRVACIVVLAGMVRLRAVERHVYFSVLEGLAVVGAYVLVVLAFAYPDRVYDGVAVGSHVGRDLAHISADDALYHIQYLLWRICLELKDLDLRISVAAVDTVRHRSLCKAWARVS